MDKLSDAEQKLRDAAQATVVNIGAEYEAGTLTKEQVLEQLSSLERNHRLQADQASAPVYAEALITRSFEFLPPEEALKQFRVVYKARAQSPHSQTLISKVERDFFRKFAEKPEDALPWLEIATELLKGAIHVEDVYIELMIERMDALTHLGRTEEAASIAEHLPTDTTTSLPYETRLEYLAKQFKAVDAMNNSVRSILAFQKYNDKTAQKQEQTPRILQLRAQILEEIGRVYMQEREFAKAGKTLRSSALCLQKLNELGNEEGARFAHIRAQALTAAFCALDYTTVDAILADGISGPLVDIVKAVQIQPIEVLKTVTE